MDLPLFSLRHAADAGIVLDEVLRSPLPVPVSVGGQVVGKLMSMRLDREARMVFGTVELECPPAGGAPILSCLIEKNRLDGVLVVGPRASVDLFARKAEAQADEPLIGGGL